VSVRIRISPHGGSVRAPNPREQSPPPGPRSRRLVPLASEAPPHRAPVTLCLKHRLTQRLIRPSCAVDRGASLPPHLAGARSRLKALCDSSPKRCACRRHSCPRKAGRGGAAAAPSAPLWKLGSRKAFAHAAIHDDQPGHRTRTLPARDPSPPYPGCGDGYPRNGEPVTRRRALAV
jgi:hypothetical protein